MGKKNKFLSCLNSLIPIGRVGIYRWIEKRFFGVEVSILLIPIGRVGILYKIVGLGILGMTSQFSNPDRASRNDWT